MASKRLPDSDGGSADIGAQYFTIRNPEFRAFLKRYAGEDSWGLWDGRLRYQGTSGEWLDMRPADRFVGIPRMSAITRSISAGLDLHANVRIDHIQRAQDDKWVLTDTDGQCFEGYDAVILTPPPVQTQDLLTDSGLGNLAEDMTIRISRLQACWTVVAHFPDGAGADFDGIMPDSQRLHWAANNSSKPSRNDRGEWWVLHGDPDWSDANTNRNPEWVQQELLQELKACTGISAAPEQCLVHRWLYARPKEGTTPGHLWFDDEAIGIAGDWLDGGRVEGAFNSASGLINRLVSIGAIARNPSLPAGASRNG